MGRDKPLQARLEEPHLGAAADDKSTCHQSLSTPSCHRAWRHAIPPTHLRNRQNRFGHLFDGLARRRREILDEQPQVMLNIPPFQHQGRPTVGAKSRDPVAQILVRITLGILDLTQELLGPIDLLQPAFLRRISRLLVFQLFHRGMAIHLAHPRVPFVVCEPATSWPSAHDPNADHPVILSIALGIDTSDEKIRTRHRSDSRQVLSSKRCTVHPGASRQICPCWFVLLAIFSPIHPSVFTDERQDPSSLRHREATHMMYVQSSTMDP